MSRKKSILETSYLLLGAIFGVVLTRLTEQPLLLAAVEAFLGVSVTTVLLVLARKRKQVFENARRLVFQGVRWVIAGIAGSIFGIGYTVLLLDGLAGVVLIGLNFVLVALAIDIVRTTEGGPAPLPNARP